MKTTRRILNKLERRALLLTKAAWQRFTPPSRPKQVVFIAGVQRSGTNMMMDVLENSLETYVIHERDPRAFERYQMRPPPVIRELLRRSHAKVFVIKALCELQRLRELMSEFAPAKAIWVVRDYRDVTNSMLVSFRNQAKQVQRISEDRDSDEWRGEGMSDETHALVRELVHPGIDDASAAALTWYFRNVLFYEQEFDRDPNVLMVSYEDMVTDPKRYFAEIFNFIGVRFTPRVSSKVFASSVRRRDPPVIEQGVRNLCEDFSRRLENTLKATW